jgi:hypothetical protein
MLSSGIQCLIPLAHIQHTDVEVLMPLYFYTTLRRASAPRAGLLGKCFWRVLNVKHEFDFSFWEREKYDGAERIFKILKRVLFLNSSPTCSHRVINVDEEEYLLIKSGVK